jgi:hypothetical protein
VRKRPPFLADNWPSDVGRLLPAMNIADLLSSGAMEDHEFQSLTELVDAAVAIHFAEHLEAVKARLRKRVEDSQLEMLDAFFAKIQDRYVNRITALEEDITANGRTLQKVRQYSERSNDDLRRLSTGIDTLIKDKSRIIGGCTE